MGHMPKKLKNIWLREDCNPSPTSCTLVGPSPVRLIAIGRYSKAGALRDCFGLSVEVEMLLMPFFLRN